MGANYKHARESPLLGGTNDGLAVNGNAEYFPVSGVNPANAGIGPPQLLIPRGGFIHQATGYLSVVPGGAATREFTLYLNGAPTLLILQFGPADQIAQNDAVQIAVARDDLVAWHSDGGVGVPNAAVSKASAIYQTI